MVWSQLMGSGDILRQQVGLALLDQWVVSIDGLTGSWRAFAMAALFRRAVGQGFRQLPRYHGRVSTSVAMGALTFWQCESQCRDRASPTELCPRLVQLFTIGLYQSSTWMARRCSRAASRCRPINQTDVSQGARVWTGYTYANAINATPDRLQLGMVINPLTHETGATSFWGSPFRRAAMERPRESWRSTGCLPMPMCRPSCRSS